MNTGVLKEMDDWIVPITRFNKGEANRIIAEVHDCGSKAIFKNNKRAAIIMSPEYYDSVMEQLEDASLLAEAVVRMREMTANFHTMEEVMAENGITVNDLEGWEDVEID